MHALVAFSEEELSEGQITSDGLRGISQSDGKRGKQGGVLATPQEQ